MAQTDGMVVLAAALAMVGQGFIDEKPNLWVREAGSGSIALDPEATRDGQPCWVVDFKGTQDWSVELGRPMPVKAGERVRVSTDLRIEGVGTAGLSFVIRNGDTVKDWTAGGEQLRASGGWQGNSATYIAAGEATSIQPRLVGYGPAKIWFGRVRKETRSLPVLKATPVTVSSRFLKCVLDPRSLAVTVTDRRSGKVWHERGADLSQFQPTSCKAGSREVRIDGISADGENPLRVRFALDADKPEATWEVAGTGPMANDLALPGPLEASPRTIHILPMNMGIALPADDPKVDEQWLVGYGGHGLCMGFYGQLDGGAGVLTILGRSDDFLLAVRRRGGRLEAEPRWRPEMGKFGYPRRLRMVFFDKADHNTLARRYRQHAVATGLVKTLRDKARANPLVAKVARAANLWTWGDKLPLAKAAHEAGLRDVLWSGGGDPAELRAIRGLGYVVGRYDIYQDVMDPSKYGDLPWTHPDWTREAWPDKLVRDANGDWVKGWVVQDKQGRDVPCAVCCDLEAIAFARERIGKELRDHPDQARFIDTTTASEYRECYDPRHRMTRGQSRAARMKLLQLVTDFGLVTGSETGHEASVPHLVYYEGMMSLGPYRVADAGTDPPKLYDELPERVRTFQLGPKYRIPLWQLVYGDCTVSQWYWGDFSNKNAQTWTIRDCWNQLYGTPPLYFTDAKGFAKSRNRFVQSYRETHEVLAKVAMRRMLSHRYLTADKTVQQTRWDNGVTVTVNFGDRAFEGISPGGYRVSGG